MFTITDKEVGSLLTDEKCFNDLYDLYYDYQYRYYYNKLVLVLENRIVYELPLKMISVKWAVACTEKCLHFFEEERPDDNRPRKAIEAARQWIIDPTINIAVIAAARDHAANAANAVIAASAAAYASAAASAAAASVNSSYAAAYASRASISAANAADSANAANANAANAAIAEQKWSRNKLKEIVGEYINDYKSDLKNTLIVQVNIIHELSDIIIKYVI